MSTKPEITAESITTIINDNRPTSLTDISRALGCKGTISGSVAARIRELVPNVADLLAANKPAKDGNAPKETASEAKPVVKKAAKVSGKPAAGKKPAGKAEYYPIPDCTPFRHSGSTPSGYAKIWAILHAHMGTGISKSDLTAKYKAWSGKPDANCGFDVHVVISPREDGSCHRSASKAAQSYWVQRENDFLRLRLIGEGKK